MVTKLTEVPAEFQDFLSVTSTLAQSFGFKIYLVGGIVRDLLLGRNIVDLDIVVDGDAIALAYKIAQQFQSKVRKHHSFGTATVYFKGHKIDFATARKEHYTHPGALPRVKGASLKEDLSRRDFTINAMAVSLNQFDYGELIDYYNGMDDLKKKVVRVLHPNSFVDDPTRIIRAIRFEQRFGFVIEPQTFIWMRQALAQGALTFVHRHRLTDELIHILQEPRPYFYIKRVDALCGFSFLHQKIQLKQDDYKLFLRIQYAIVWYNRRFPTQRKLDIWLIYFAVFLRKLTFDDLSEFFHGFCLRKGDRIRIASIKVNIALFKKLDAVLKPYNVYKIIDHLSFESIIFLYAYHTRPAIRKNIEYFFDELVHIRLKVKGDDLQMIGAQPTGLYSRFLGKLLEIKMNKNLQTKQEELVALKEIVKRYGSCKVSTRLGILYGK